MTSTFAITSAARNMHYNNNTQAGGSKKSLSDFKTETENKLSDFGSSNTGYVKTVNVSDLFAGGTAMSSDPRGGEVGFNEHKVGSKEWLAYGNETGVWVNGVNAEDFLSKIDPGNNEEKRFKNTENFLSEMAETLQIFQDEMVRLAAAGTPVAQMKAFAQQVMSGSGAADLESMQTTPDAGSGASKYGIANLLQVLLTEEPHNIERTLLNNTKEVDGNRANSGMGLVRSMAGGFHERIAETKKSLGIKPVDLDSQRRDLTNERARFMMSIRKEIGKLPVDQQDAAWEEVSLQLDAAVEEALATDGVPTTPTFDGPAANVVPYYENALQETSRKNDRDLREGVATGAAVGMAAGGPVGAVVGGVVGGVVSIFRG